MAHSPMPRASACRARGCAWRTFHAWKPFRRTTWWWRPTPSTNFRRRWARDCGAPRGLRWSAIEPGTPAGFARIRELRGELLGQGARMIAPCPAETPCPLSAPDWCHFAGRVERSSLHRRVKDAGLNYEDEKFSYVALGREPAALARGRIIRRPEHRPGLVVLEICRASGTGAEQIPRRDRPAFRAARAAAWGDGWELGAEPTG